MKAKQYISIMATAAVALLAVSCVKDTLYNTPHPDKGALTITLQSIAANDNYVVNVDGQTADITGSPFTFPQLLEAGTYRMMVHNRPEGFSFDGVMAYINSLSDKSRTDGTSVIPLPGYLKTFSQEITVTADDTLRISSVPVQCVRDLQLELKVTQGRPELIQSVTGTLSGIAGTFDMEKGQTSGEPAYTVFSFTREGDMLTADVRLLGTMGNEQTLVLDIVFTDGGRTQHTGIDMVKALKEFNDDMATTYRVNGTLETPVGMEEGNATITGWEAVNGDDANAEM